MAGVERRERLVEQDDLGLDGQRPGQGDPLLLPARELMRVAPAVPGQPHQLEQLVDPAAAVRARGADRRRRCARRSGAGTARPPGARSRCAGARSARSGGAASSTTSSPELDLAVVGPLEAGHDPQQRRLAAARRAENGGERPVRDGQVDAAQDAAGGRTTWPRPMMRRSFMRPPLCCGASRAALAGRRHACGLAVEPAAEHVAGHGGDEHHDAGVRRRLAVGHVRLVGPELGGQRLHVGRDGGRAWP